MPRIFFATAVLLVAAALPCHGQAQKRFMGGPVTLEDQGSFFVGGEKKALPAGRGGAAGGHVTVHQMYVQYQIDWIDRRVEKR